MSLKKKRFFAGFMGAQAKWLNSMSKKGYRLIKTGKLQYEFDECEPGKYVYTVEYVGDKSLEESDRYKAFLEDMGYRVFYKNINLDYSIYKATWRPFAEKGGRISTTRSTYNKELLIIEKEDDGTPFELHTEKEDKAEYYKRLSRPWYVLVFLFLLFAILAWPLIPGVIALAALALLSIVPIIIAEVKIHKLKKENQLEE
jgi:lipopolysaccharide export LptBFGC system permease protein LptF